MSRQSKFITYNFRTYNNFSNYYNSSIAIHSLEIFLDIEMHFMTLTPVTHRCSFGHPGIKDEFGLRLGSSLLHLGCDQQAGFIIHAVVIPAVWLATIPTTSIEANRPQMTGISSTNPWGRR